jgi:hypothetical protein
MKLSKKTRAALRRRKLTKFRWSAFEPKQGRTYSLEGTGERIRIVAVARRPNGYDVAALIVDDPARLLPITVGEYEEEPIRVLRDGPIPEPEAVDFLTQQRFSREGRMNQQERMTEMVAAMEDMRGALEQRVADNPGLKQEVGRELAQIRGRIDTAKRKLEGRANLDAAV